MRYEKPALLVEAALNAVQSQSKDGANPDNSVPPITFSTTSAYEADE